MKKLILFSIFISSTLAYPALFNDLQPSEIPYVRLLSAAPIGPDGSVVDTPEVTVAKAQHEAAQANQRIRLANEASKSADPVLDTTADPATILESTATTSAPTSDGAPLGPDGQVIDTPEVMKAKADHAVAQLNERLKLAQENIKSSEQPVAVILPGPAILPAPVPIIPQIIYPVF